MYVCIISRLVLVLQGPKYWQIDSQYFQEEAGRMR